MQYWNNLRPQCDRYTALKHPDHGRAITENILVGCIQIKILLKLLCQRVNVTMCGSVLAAVC